MHPLARTEFERILLIKPSSLGDIVHALPVLNGLRRRYPAAHISWLVNTAYAPLIATHPQLSEVIEFDRRTYARIGRSLSASRQFAGLMRSLRTRRFDLTVDLQGLFRSGFLSRSSGAPVRIGPSDAREMAGAFYTHRVQVGGMDTHAIERNYAVGQMLGFADVPIAFDLAISTSERQRANEALRQAGVDPAGPFAAVLPGARWETKRWFPDRFAHVIAALARQTGTASILLGAPDEADACAQVQRLAACMGATAPNLAGQTGLRELVAIIEQASVVICHDSAPMHIAAALGRPMVCLIGPTNPRRTGPYGATARVIQAGVPCAPCYLRRLRQCPYNHDCMRSIHPSDVVDAAVAALGRPASSPGVFATTS